MVGHDVLRLAVCELLASGVQLLAGSKHAKREIHHGHACR